MSGPHKNEKAPPDRMREYRVEAQMKQTPDLHRLAQLFVNMALSRTETGHRQADSSSRHYPSNPVGS